MKNKEKTTFVIQRLTPKKQWVDWTKAYATLESAQTHLASLQSEAGSVWRILKTTYVIKAVEEIIK